MFKQSFRCTFLSDIILNSDTATEGNHESLNYIPGSNFLGIVAKNYDLFDKDKDKAYDIFHSGKVQFGDGHLSIGNKRSLKQPASWFYEKSDDKHENIYIHHKVTDRMRENFTKEEQQLKQIRTGYFVENKTLSIKHNFSIKSAHDKEKRRSKDTQMYGYDALRKGSEFIFYVRSEDESLLKEIATKLDGKHNIGKSKTAQYGRVVIEKLEKLEESYKSVENDEFTLVYFDSCCAFLDVNGNFTYQPELTDFGFTTENKIIWEKSQIRTKVFAPWNGKRKNRDANRICIDKGSVLYIKGDVKIDSEFIEKGVGVFKNEGFGRVIINPDFLVANENGIYENSPKKHEENNKNITAVVENGNEDEVLLELLKEKQEKSENFSIITETTNNFVKKYGAKFKSSKITSSQWGAIRSRTQRILKLGDLKKDLFRDEISHEDDRGLKIIDDRGGYLRHGKTKSAWIGLFEILRSELNELDKTIARRFLVNLCSEMAKKAK